MSTHESTAAARASSGAIVWFTGLSGAGKSTLAGALRHVLAGRHSVEVLDGDELRKHLSPDLGYSRQDRDANVRRIGYVARLLARHGVVVIAAAISPYASTRDEVRALAVSEGIPFVEVFVEASLTALIERDVKGLYRKALAGEIQHFTGISDPYEPPLRADVSVRTDSESVADSTERIINALTRLMPWMA